MGTKRPMRWAGGFARRERMRRDLFELQEGLCHLCGKPMLIVRSPAKPGKEWVTPKRFATFDHKQPASKGGTTHIANLALAHASCNAARNDRPLEEVQSEKI